MTVLTRQVDEAPAREVSDGVEILRIAAPGERAVAATSFIVGALAQLKTRPHDVVHCHQALSPATIGALARISGGKPVVVKLAGPTAIGDIGTVRRGKLAGMRRWLLSHVDGWICPSDVLVDEIHGYLPGARVAGPNRVDAAALAPVPAAERAAIRAPWGSPAA